MRKLNDILKTVKTGLALYGCYCLVSGSVSKRISENWNNMVDHTEDKLHEFVYGKPKEKVIDAEFEEVKE